MRKSYSGLLNETFFPLKIFFEVFLLSDFTSTLFGL